MKLVALTPMLRTWDLPASIAFYTRILGFKCDSFSAELGWASVSLDGVSVMLAVPNQHDEAPALAPAFTGSLYFRTDNVDELWRFLKDKAQVCYPIETFAYGMREFGIYDNNRYLLQFGQAVATPVKKGGGWPP